MLLMRIPNRLWRVKYSSILDGGLQGVVRAYIGRIHDALDEGDGLLFWGANGVGKTSAAIVLAKEARRCGASVMFATAEEIRGSVLEKVQFSDDMSFIDRARTVELLVVDDLGKEHAGATGFGENLFESLMRTRASECLSTVITTNLTTDELREKYGVSMMDVLREAMVPVECLGENRRERPEGLRNIVSTG